MRQLNKVEPKFYKEFLDSEKPQTWEDFTIGEELRKYMLEYEQNWQCAYTELRINETNRSSHIDHYKRKHRLLFPNLIFDYNNLFAADISNDFGARYKDQQVKSKDDYDNLLSPVSPEISDAFSYNLSSGEIEGRNPKAQHTITVFKLNHKYLKRRRLEKIKQLYDFINIYTMEDSINYIGEFESMIRYIYTVNNI